MEELSAALHKFNQNIVEVSRRVSRDTITCCMTQVILPLLEKIGEIDVRFRCASPMPNEVYFPGMKSSCMNEFELTIILTNLLAAKTFEDGGSHDGSLSCYGRVLPLQSLHQIGDVLVEAGSSQGVVSAHRIRQIFAQLASQAVSFLPVVSGMSVDVSVKEPFTVIKILKATELVIFELVPAFMFLHDWPTSASTWPTEVKGWLSESDIKSVKDAGFYAVALPCSASPLDPSLFRISFSNAEKYLLRPAWLENYKPTAVCRKDSERILRMIRESDKDAFIPVNCYHIKTILLHDCMRWPEHASWLPEKLAERFLDLLRDLILVLENQNLPHFFIRDCNLLRDYNTEQLRAAAGRLRVIYHDIYSSPSTSIRLQCY
ncbi:unnamed protein product [Candidula unifasciata]|uniref:Mab-21-like HhH/H2TH-like domain-containing protein n=1 Tax=Candidula unifasciata TaxID=100452 RepID=A0A8S3YJE2_9EUPU|nr:unnamed protein product [Candidula unifasciata]